MHANVSNSVPKTSKVPILCMTLIEICNEFSHFIIFFAFLCIIIIKIVLIILAIYILVALVLNGINACYTVLSYWIRARELEVPICIKRLLLKLIGFPILCKCFRVQEEKVLSEKENLSKSILSNLIEGPKRGNHPINETQDSKECKILLSDIENQEVNALETKDLRTASVLVHKTEHSEQMTPVISNSLEQVTSELNRTMRKLSNYMDYSIMQKQIECLKRRKKAEWELVETVLTRMLGILYCLSVGSLFLYYILDVLYG